jgi:isoamylase
VLFRSRSLAMTISSAGGAARTHLIFNTYWEALDFELPPPAPDSPWRLIADTNLAPPADIRGPSDAPPVTGTSYRAAPRSVVILIATV